MLLFELGSGTVVWNFGGSNRRFRYEQQSDGEGVEVRRGVAIKKRVNKSPQMLPEKQT